MPEEDVDVDDVLAEDTEVIPLFIFQKFKSIFLKKKSFFLPGSFFGWQLHKAMALLDSLVK